MNPAYLPSLPILFKNLAGAYFRIESLVLRFLATHLPTCPPAAAICPGRLNLGVQSITALL
jgi:hypothetical protein